MKKINKTFEFDYEEVKNKALAQLKTGKPILGKDGALAPSDFTLYSNGVYF